MGNTQMPDGADHDFYRRPDGKEQILVQMVDQGSEPDAGAVPGSAAPYSGSPGGGAGDRTQNRAVLDKEEQARRSRPLPGSRFNYSLAAAWVLVGLLLAHGLVWLTESFPVPQFDPITGISTDETPGAMVMNLYSMGPFPFLIGLVGAFTLLTVQAAGFRRKARS